MGALNCVNYNGCISKSGYYTSSLQSGLLQAFNNIKGASALTNPNQFFMGVYTEILARRNSLLSGISTYGSGMMFRAYVSTPLTLSHTLMFYGFYDVILEVDCVSKTIISK